LRKFKSKSESSFQIIILNRLSESAFTEVLIYASCKRKRKKPLFPRRRESIAIRSAALDSRLRGNDGFLAWCGDGGQMLFACLFK
jgi:hypothetical protein